MFVLSVVDLPCTSFSRRLLDLHMSLERCLQQRVKECIFFGIFGVMVYGFLEWSLHVLGTQVRRSFIHEVFGKPYYQVCLHSDTVPIFVWPPSQHHACLYRTKKKKKKKKKGDMARI
jgi:hypothetical protein